MSIQHFNYTQDSNPHDMLDQENADISDAQSQPQIDLKIQDYLFIYRVSPNQLQLISCTQPGIKYPFISLNPIIDFTIIRIKLHYYLATLETDSVLRYNKINHQFQISLVNEVQLEKQANSILYNLNDNGVIVKNNNWITLVPFNDKPIKQDLKCECKQLQSNQTHIFILTNDSKLIILNKKSLQIISEHNTKYIKYPPLKFQLFQRNNSNLGLFTITQSRRIIYWVFDKEDLHTAQLVPQQSIKLKSNNYNKDAQFLDFFIDSTSNFLFIAYQFNDNSIQFYVCVLNLNKLSNEESIIKHIREFKKDNSQAKIIFQLLVPQQELQNFLHGTNVFESEENYLKFQEEFQKTQEQDIILVDEDWPWIFGIQSIQKQKIEFCYFYCDLVLTAVNEENYVKKAHTSQFKHEGSKIIQQSPLILPPDVSDQQNNQITKSQQEIPNTDPLLKVQEIIDTQLLPKIQQDQQLNIPNQQISMICNEVKNELAEDPEFIFQIKDLIETSVKKEIDKSVQNDHNALIKLEQKFKQEMQSLESSMQDVISQNLEVYSQTCENFILDNFNQQYFETMIDDKIQNYLKQQANLELSEVTQLVQQSTNEFFQTDINQRYSIELNKMSQNVTQIFDKVTTYFNQLQFIDQTKINNFNQFIEGSQIQLQAINKNITTLLESNKPGQEVITKIDNVISQMEQLHHQYVTQIQNNQEQLQQQQQQQQQQQNLALNSTDQRISILEQSVNQLKNGLMTQQPFNTMNNQNNEAFIKGMTTQLTQMHIKLTQPQISMSQIQEVLGQLILQFQFFILKFGST